MRYENGIWEWWLQLVTLKHGYDVFWLELLSSRRADIDDRYIVVFFAQMRRLGLASTRHATFDFQHRNTARAVT